MTINIPTIANWKTTLAGLAGYAVLFFQAMDRYHSVGLAAAFKDPRIWLTFIMSTGLLAAKDGNVTGGTVGQPSSAQAIADSNHAPATGPAAPAAPPPAH